MYTWTWTFSLGNNYCCSQFCFSNYFHASQFIIFGDGLPKIPRTSMYAFLRNKFCLSTGNGSRQLPFFTYVRKTVHQIMYSKFYVIVTKSVMYYHLGSARHVLILIVLDLRGIISIYLSVFEEERDNKWKMLLFCSDVHKEVLQLKNRRFVEKRTILTN